MSLLGLSPDQFLSTTRSVRNGPNLTTPVPDDSSVNASRWPASSFSQNQIAMRFVAVRDRDCS